MNIDPRLHRITAAQPYPLLFTFHETEYQRLRGELQAAHEASFLPELPSDLTRAALNDLLVRLRLAQPPRLP